MNNKIRSVWTQFRDDRPLLVLCSVLLVAGIVYAIVVSLSLSATELQVATRYTAFGGTQYYRSKWYYLIGFVVFGLLVSGLHIGAVLKLHRRGMRSLALAFAWLSMMLLGVLFLVTLSVLGIAYLS